MKRGYIGIALCTLVAVGGALSLPSCGHSQKLVSLQVQPQTFTFLEAYLPPPAVNGTEQYTVIGTYIHPPATMDLTSQATWKVDDGVVTMSTPGLFTPAQGACGGGDISASVPEGTGGAGNVMFAFATVTVDNPASELCPGGGKLATLAVGVVGTGSVVSLPAAINCSQTGGICIATYDVGSSVLLTASAIPVTWANCPGASGDTCVVSIPTGGAAVSASFN
ncbi:MAG TPA: hypothetical protein VIH78_07380 [Terriglobales bacterium]